MKLILRCLVGCLLVLSASVGAGTPANAAVPRQLPRDAPADCSDGKACFYAEFDYKTPVRAEQPVVGCHQVGAFVSVYNNSGSDIVVFDSDQGCWGDPVLVPAHSGNSALTYKAYYYATVEDDDD